MKKRKLRIPAILAAAGVCAVLAASTAFAGEWHKDGKVWRYTDDSGRGVNSGWVQDNGSWYYLKCDFNELTHEALLKAKKTKKPSDREEVEKT